MSSRDPLGFIRVLTSPERVRETERGELVDAPSAALMNAVAPHTAVTIRLPRGIALALSADADPAWIGALVRNLAGARS